jgi:ABC-type branched-subunit amino acid transport system ATPase component
MSDQRGLETRSLTVRYGGVVANDDVTISVPPGSITGLIGPNGAGKTTLLDAVTGFAPSSGEVKLDGAALDGLAPHRRARCGLARTWQSLELFDELTVRENVQVAATRLTVRSMIGDIVWPRRRRASDDHDGALALLGLETVADERPTSLSLGHQKLVGVARALASSPSCLLLDEPAAGLDTSESAELGRRLDAIAWRGTTVLLVDHDMDLVLDVCTHIYVLDFGRLIASGSPAEIREDERVIAAYLGTSADAEVLA